MEQANSEPKKDVRGSLLIIEGLLIILLVLFSGFLAYQNQRLTQELKTKGGPLPSETVVPSPLVSPSVLPSASPSATPKVVVTPKATATPSGAY